MVRDLVTITDRRGSSFIYNLLPLVVNIPINHSKWRFLSFFGKEWDVTYHSSLLSNSRRHLCHHHVPLKPLISFVSWTLKILLWVISMWAFLTALSSIFWRPRIVLWKETTKLLKFYGKKYLRNNIIWWEEIQVCWFLLSKNYSYFGPMTLLWKFYITKESLV